MSTGRNKLAINIAHNCVENDDSTPGLVTPGVPALTSFVNGLKKCRKEILIRRARNFSFLKVGVQIPLHPEETWPVCLVLIRTSFYIQEVKICLLGFNLYQSVPEETKYV